MSHALALVVIPHDATDLDAAVKTMMDPYCEHTEDDGWWDFWVIGGRYRNVIAAESGPLSEMGDSFTIVTPEGATHRETWIDGRWTTTDAQYDDARWALDPATRVVAVDYHS